MYKEYQYVYMTSHIILYHSLKDSHHVAGDTLNLTTFVFTPQQYDYYYYFCFDYFRNIVIMILMHIYEFE